MPADNYTRVRPTAAPISTVNAPRVQYVEDWFIYDLDITGLAAGGTDNQSILIQADSDFKLSKLMLMADIAHAAQTAANRVIPLCTMQIVDSGSGRQLFSNPVALGALFGDGTLPHILPVPRIFKARSSISITTVNYDAASTYNIRLAFEGTKLFTLGG